MFQSHSIIESLECYIKTNISPQILKEAFPAMVLWLLVPDKQFKSPIFFFRSVDFSKLSRSKSNIFYKYPYTC